MPKIVDHDERREFIAWAACATIATEGLARTTLTKVARNCGLTTGAIAHYFTDKDALLQAALLQAYRDQIARMDRRVKTLPYSLLNVLSEALPINTKSRMTMKVWLAFWGRAIGDAGIANAQKRIHGQWTQRVADELNRAIDVGLLPSSLDIAHEAEALIAHIRGLCIDALLAPETWSRKRQLVFLSRYLERLWDRESTTRCAS